MKTSENNINILGKENDSCTITATIKDSSDATVTEYLGKVIFNIIEGANSAKFSSGSSISVDVNNGIATAILHGQCNLGTVKITASSLAGSKEIYNNNDLVIGVNIGNSLK